MGLGNKRYIIENIFKSNFRRAAIFYWSIILHESFNVPGGKRHEFDRHRHEFEIKVMTSMLCKGICKENFPETAAFSLIINFHSPLSKSTSSILLHTTLRYLR